MRERNGVVVEVKTMLTMGENALADSSVLADNVAAAGNGVTYNLKIGGNYL
ncbi:MAG: hypothetical protein K2N72_08495 [Oscillospiraceae bacterium]|nr:hypothetical protein [Oscillospiraceae bacterium]